MFVGNTRFVAAILPLMAAFVLVAGCQSENTGGSSDSGPADVQSCIVDIRGHYAEVREAVEANNLASVHETLHHLFDTIEALPNLAAKENLQQADIETIESSSEEMLDALTEIDGALHAPESDSDDSADDKPDFENLLSVFDTAIKKVESIAGATAPSAAEN